MVWLNSIGYLNAQALINGDECVKWQQVQLKSGDLCPRINPFVAPLSYHELLILGGHDEDDNDLGDGYILNTRDFCLEKVMDSSMLKFNVAKNNQCAMTRQGQVTGLIRDQNGILHMVSYTRGEPEVQIVKSIGRYY